MLIGLQKIWLFLSVAAIAVLSSPAQAVPFDFTEMPAGMTDLGTSYDDPETDINISSSGGLYGFNSNSATPFIGGYGQSGLSFSWDGGVAKQFETISIFNDYVINTNIGWSATLESGGTQSGSLAWSSNTTGSNALDILTLDILGLTGAANITSFSLSLSDPIWVYVLGGSFSPANTFPIQSSNAPSAVPAPATLALLGAGLVGLLVSGRGRQNHFA